jgi:hypothetical protein
MTKFLLKKKIRIMNWWKNITFRRKYLTPELKKELEMWDNID